jgi:hypothetical protein
VPEVLKWSPAEKTYRKKSRELTRELNDYKKALGATSVTLLPRGQPVTTIREAVANVRAYNDANPNRRAGSKTYFQHYRLSEAALKDSEFVERCDAFKTKRFARADAIARDLLGQAVDTKQSDACKTSWLARKEATETSRQHQHQQRQLTHQQQPLLPSQQLPQPQQPPANSPCYEIAIKKGKAKPVSVNICQLLIMALHGKTPMAAINESLQTFTNKEWKAVARVLYGPNGTIPGQKKRDYVGFVLSLFVSTDHVAVCPHVLDVCGELQAQTIRVAREWFEAERKSTVSLAEVADANNTRKRPQLPPAAISSSKHPRVDTNVNTTPSPISEASQIANQAAAAAIAAATSTRIEGGQ